MGEAEAGEEGGHGGCSGRVWGFEDGDDGGLFDMVDPGCWGNRADRAAVGRGGFVGNTE